MKKIISTKIHGIVDYAMAAVLILLPRLMNWGEPPATLLTTFGVATVIYSLLTRYELGAFRVIPMSAHLMLDFLSGASLICAAVILSQEPDGVRWGLGILGLLEVGAAMMTNMYPSPEVERDTVTRTRSAGGV